MDCLIDIKKKPVLQNVVCLIEAEITGCVLDQLDRIFEMNLKIEMLIMDEVILTDSAHLHRTAGDGGAGGVEPLPDGQIVLLFKLTL